MEVIRINRERIKIMLSPADMVEMDISCEVLDNFDKRGKEAFGKIMQEARDKCGFISCGRKILVQVFPSKDGGCEMFITKVNDSELTSHVKKQKKFYYKFEVFQDMLRFCAAIMNSINSCAAYKDIEKGIYYIVTDEKCNICGEFGGMECSETCDVYILERCKMVCEDAGSVLGRLA